MDLTDLRDLRSLGESRVSWFPDKSNSVNETRELKLSGWMVLIRLLFSLSCVRFVSPWSAVAFTTSIWFPARLRVSREAGSRNQFVFISDRRFWSKLRDRSCRPERKAFSEISVTPDSFRWRVVMEPKPFLSKTVELILPTFRRNMTTN